VRWYITVRSDEAAKNWGNEAAVRRDIVFGNRVLDAETTTEDGGLTMIVEVDGHNAAGRADYQANRLRSRSFRVRLSETLPEARVARGTFG
jgi:hypothetical protein